MLQKLLLKLDISVKSVGSKVYIIMNVLKNIFSKLKQFFLLKLCNFIIYFYDYKTYENALYSSSVLGHIYGNRKSTIVNS